eukprot:TRINITY_DN1841_c1_g1_i1.p1 TRINITY_DN1841_c1_g1~~TRINITY_DN1841_c1_g1_i1.p1  ORF type:complete len:335 (+),score=128.93 TRINITY_DN1841_c1_g1_i1:222-1226(+)
MLSRLGGGVSRHSPPPLLRQGTLAFAALSLLFLLLPSPASSCSSRSTPKPRSPIHSAIRPDITFQTYACPPAYAAWYCLNGATCFAVKIAESILYNCECADGYMGQRCEFKDPDGSYLPARKKLLLLQSPGFGLIFLSAFGLVILAGAIGAALTKHRTQSKLKMLRKEVEVISIPTTTSTSSSSSSSGSSPPSNTQTFPSYGGGGGHEGRTPPSHTFQNHQYINNSSSNSNRSNNNKHYLNPSSSYTHHIHESPPAHPTVLAGQQFSPQQQQHHHHHHLNTIQRQTISYEVASRGDPLSVPPPAQLQNNSSYYDEISRSSSRCHFLFNSSIVKC